MAKILTCLTQKFKRFSLNKILTICQKFALLITGRREIITCIIFTKSKPTFTPSIEITSVN